MINELNEIISKYNQFKHSQLWLDIMKVLNCDEKTAASYADSHCNMVSFWACLKASGKTNIAYDDFFRKSLATIINDPENGVNRGCNEHGRINVNKKYLCRAVLDLEYEPIYYKSYDYIFNPIRLNENKLYQVKISGHYMACYIENGIFNLSDTSSRGIGVVATKYVTPTNFLNLLEI